PSGDKAVVKPNRCRAITRSSLPVATSHSRMQQVFSFGFLVSVSRYLPSGEKNAVTKLAPETSRRSFSVARSHNATTLSPPGCGYQQAAVEPSGETTML